MALSKEQAYGLAAAKADTEKIAYTVWQYTGGNTPKGVKTPQARFLVQAAADPPPRWVWTKVATATPGEPLVDLTAPAVVVPAPVAPSVTDLPEYSALKTAIQGGDTLTIVDAAETFVTVAEESTRES